VVAAEHALERRCERSLTLSLLPEDVTQGPQAALCSHEHQSISRWRCCNGVRRMRSPEAQSAATAGGHYYPGSRQGKPDLGSAAGATERGSRGSRSRRITRRSRIARTTSTVHVHHRRSNRGESSNGCGHVGAPQDPYARSEQHRIHRGHARGRCEESLPDVGRERDHIQTEAQAGLTAPIVPPRRVASLPSARSKRPAVRSVQRSDRRRERCEAA
jgi:hypothetical protein